MDENRYLQIVRGFGLYHVAVSLPLALPVLSSYILALLRSLHDLLSLPGTWHNYDASHLLFLNLFACLAVFWGVLRFRHPSRLLGHYEGWAMVAFSIIVLWNVWLGASALWLVIAIVDGLGAMLHLSPRFRGLEEPNS